MCKWFVNICIYSNSKKTKAVIAFGDLFPCFFGGGAIYSASRMANGALVSGLALNGDYVSECYTITKLAIVRCVAPPLFPSWIVSNARKRLRPTPPVSAARIR